MPTDPSRGAFEIGQIRLHRQCKRLIRVLEFETERKLVVSVCVEDLLGEWEGGWIYPFELSDPISEMEALARAAQLEQDEAGSR